MQRYIIQLSYKGTNYHGWQIQENAPTVQGLVNKALSTILNTQIETIGAGRTDTGVHAKHYIAHFDYNAGLPYIPEKTVYKLNGILPNDIVIENIQKTDNSFHARFDAVSRTYKYLINQKKNPFMQELSYQLFNELNIDAMNQAAGTLLNYSDFTSFSKLHSDVKTNNCTVTEAFWSQGPDNLLIFTITANRFLRNMVRAIVGTLLDVGKNKINTDRFKEIIELKDRSKAGVSAPAQGLYLWNIEYNTL